MLKFLHGMMSSKCDFLYSRLEPPELGIIFRDDNPDFCAKPIQFTKVARGVGNGCEEIFFWYPIAPPGYASFGCVVSRADEAPSLQLVCCPRMDLVSQTNIREDPISRSVNSKGTHCWSIWKVENQVQMDVNSNGSSFNKSVL